MPERRTGQRSRTLLAILFLASAASGAAIAHLGFRFAFLHDGETGRSEQRPLPVAATGDVDTSPSRADESAISERIAAAAEISDDEIRNRELASLLDAWVQLDANAVLDYLEHAPTEVVANASGVFEMLAASDPARLANIAAGFTATLRLQARRSALAVLAERDPATAIAWLEASEPDNERISLESAIATGYGRNDAEAALRWARASDSGVPPTLASSVYSGIASVDANRAATILMSELVAAGGGTLAVPRIASWTIAIARVLDQSDRDQSRQLVESLRAFDPTGATGLVQAAIRSWASDSNDPLGAVEWQLAHLDSVGTDLQSLASRLVNIDVESAMALTDRLPDNRRAEWIVDFAGVLADYDPARAAAWLDAYRGQPFYADAVGRVVSRGARRNPSAMATLIEAGGFDAGARNPEYVAQLWAERAPEAAAAWLARLPAGEVKTRAAAGLGRGWARRDFAAGLAWAMSLGAGVTRDSALTGLAESAAGNGLVDARIFAAFNSATARDDALRGTATGLVAAGFPERAMAFIDDQVDDPEIRRMLQREIDRRMIESLLGEPL